MVSHHLFNSLPTASDICADFCPLSSSIPTDVIVQSPVEPYPQPSPPTWTNANFTEPIPFQPPMVFPNYPNLFYAPLNDALMENKPSAPLVIEENVLSTQLSSSSKSEEKCEVIPESESGKSEVDEKAESVLEKIEEQFHKALDAIAVFFSSEEFNKFKEHILDVFNRSVTIPLQNLTQQKFEVDIKKHIEDAKAEFERLKKKIKKHIDMSDEEIEESLALETSHAEAQSEHKAQVELAKSYEKASTLEEVSFAEQLASLKSMGFGDHNKCIHLLLKHKGDLEAVLEDLLTL